MKTYTGIRTVAGARVEVQDGDKTYILVHKMRHSPPGLEWGYGGSGPADLARSILFDLIGERGLTPSIYQAFKFDFICEMQHETWTLTEEEIRAWLKARDFPLEQDGGVL